MNPRSGGPSHSGLTTSLAAVTRLTSASIRVAISGSGWIVSSLKSRIAVPIITWARVFAAATRSGLPLSCLPTVARFCQMSLRMPGSLRALACSKRKTDSSKRTWKPFSIESDVTKIGKSDSMYGVKICLNASFVTRILSSASRRMSSSPSSCF